MDGRYGPKLRVPLPPTYNCESVRLVHLQPKFVHGSMERPTREGGYINHSFLRFQDSVCFQSLWLWYHYFSIALFIRNFARHQLVGQRTNQPSQGWNISIGGNRRNGLGCFNVHDELEDYSSRCSHWFLQRRTHLHDRSSNPRTC